MHKIIKLIFSLSLALVLGVMMCACGETYQLRGSDVNQTLMVGETYMSTLDVVNSKDEQVGVTWASSDDAIASVSNGLVTAKSEGSATITMTCVKDTSITGSFTVTVQAEVITLSAKDITSGETLSINDTLEIKQGDRLLFLAVNQNGENKTVTLETSDSGIVSVSNNSLTAEAVGSATLTIKAGDITKTITINVITLKHTVTYVIDTDALKTEYTLEYDDEEKINLDAQAIEGYEFYRWYYDRDFTQRVTTNTYVTEDMTIYASYTKIITWTITYNTKGSVPEDAPTSYTNVDKTIIILPTPTYYAHKFQGWYANSDYTGNQIEEISLSSEGDVVLYAKWSAGVDLTKMTFSVMGDSVSSYQGENVDPNWLYFYPLYSRVFTENKVTDSSQMWFHLLEKSTGMTLDSLNCAAGSCVQACFTNAQAPSAELEDRIKLLYKSPLKKPNLIIIWMGGNDIQSAYQQPAEKFVASYCNMLDLICNKYCKNAYVMCCTIQYYRGKHNDELPYWNNLICECAAKYGCPVIDLVGTLTADNLSELAGDAGHPNSVGQQVVADRMLSEIKKNFDLE